MCNCKENEIDLILCPRFYNYNENEFFRNSKDDNLCIGNVDNVNNGLNDYKDILSFKFEIRNTGLTNVTKFKFLNASITTLNKIFKISDISNVNPNARVINQETETVQLLVKSELHEREWIRAELTSVINSDFGQYDKITLNVEVQCTDENGEQYIKKNRFVAKYKRIVKPNLSKDAISNNLKEYEIVEFK